MGVTLTGKAAAQKHPSKNPPVDPEVMICGVGCPFWKTRASLTKGHMPHGACKAPVTVPRMLQKSPLSLKVNRCRFSDLFLLTLGLVNEYTGTDP